MYGFFEKKVGLKFMNLNHIRFVSIDAFYFARMEFVGKQKQRSETAQLLSIDSDEAQQK